MKLTCAQVQERLPDLHDGLCSAIEKDALHGHLQDCAACRLHHAELSLLLNTLDALPEEQPSRHMEAKFQRMLSEELAQEAAASTPLTAQRTTRPLPQPPPGRLADILTFPLGSWFGAAAAAVLILLGAGSSALLLHDKTPAAASSDAGQQAETQRQLQALQARLDSMNQIIAYSLSHQQPDTIRLQQVSAHAKTPSSDTAQLTALLGTLAFDPSTNVRLSALEALYRHSDQKLVRDGIIASLRRERSPLVQIAMIDFLGTLQDTQSADALLSLARDPSTPEQVRDAAKRAQSLSF